MENKKLGWIITILGIIIATVPNILISYTALNAGVSTTYEFMSRLFFPIGLIIAIIGVYIYYK